MNFDDKFYADADQNLSRSTNTEKSFSIFSIMKLFASHKDDRRRVEKALEVSGLPIGKTDAIPVQKLQFEEFFNLYKNLTVRTEVEKLFDEM